MSRQKTNMFHTLEVKVSDERKELTKAPVTLTSSNRAVTALLGNRDVALALSNHKMSKHSRAGSLTTRTTFSKADVSGSFVL
jgi:hypothetical protein